MLASLTNTKKKENKTIEGFNKKFSDMVRKLHVDIKPYDTSILIYYIEAFEGEMRYQLRDKEPDNLKKAMEITEKIDRNMQSAGKSNILGFVRGTTSSSKPHDAKGKTTELEGKDEGKESMKEVADMMKQIMINCTSQMNAM